MNGDGEEIELIGLNCCRVGQLVEEVGFGIEFHEDIARSTLRCCSWCELHLTNDGLRIIPYNAVVINQRKRACRYGTTENYICPSGCITLTIGGTKVCQRSVHTNC